MYYCNYVMSGRCKTFCGETAKEIHKKFMSEYGEAESEVRKVEIFKENPEGLPISKVMDFARDFGMVISYDLYKNDLLSGKYSFEEMHYLVMGTRGRIH